MCKLFFYIKINVMSEEKKVKTIYISGKIGGIEDIAPDLFSKAENVLKEVGYKVVNPMTIEHNHDKSWLSYMRNDIKALVDCDAVYMLDNWMDSRGARVEFYIAKSLGIKVFFQHNEDAMIYEFLRDFNLKKASVTELGLSLDKVINTLVTNKNKEQNKKQNKK